MPNGNQLVQVIKKAAVDAVAASKPVQIVFGTVTVTDPLQITVEQKLPLHSGQLIISRQVSDYQTQLTINGIKEECTVHNGLKLGEKVILLRQQKGQQYIVLDRVI